MKLVLLAVVSLSLLIVVPALPLKNEKRILKQLVLRELYDLLKDEQDSSTIKKRQGQGKGPGYGYGVELPPGNNGQQGPPMGQGPPYGHGNGAGGGDIDFVMPGSLEEMKDMVIDMLFNWGSLTEPEGGCTIAFRNIVLKEGPCWTFFESGENLTVTESAESVSTSEESPEEQETHHNAPTHGQQCTCMETQGGPNHEAPNHEVAQPGNIEPLDGSVEISGPGAVNGPNHDMEQPQGQPPPDIGGPDVPPPQGHHQPDMTAPEVPPPHSGPDPNVPGPNVPQDGPNVEQPDFDMEIQHEMQFSTEILLHLPVVFQNCIDLDVWGPELYELASCNIDKIRELYTMLLHTFLPGFGIEDFVEIKMGKLPVMIENKRNSKIVRILRDLIDNEVNK